ncbi:FUSC family protein [Nocardioides alcanivorans]|uniref:FUSC family protein n=1 Tax=Nocardioides alcanivorans TaxID=2897352 RepID=UPI001F26F15A|nr:FUSC family protein [Nocardioides alcanivorans]
MPIAVAGASALFSVVVGGVGSVVRGQRSPWPGVKRHTTWHVARLAVAVVIAGTLAHLSGLGHPYWAMVAALAALAGRDHRARWQRSWFRAIGTLVGLIPAALLLALHLGPVGIVLTVIVLQFVTEILIGRNYGLALLFITPMALLMGQLAVERPMAELLLDRGIETVIGSAVALVIVWVELRRHAKV